MKYVAILLLQASNKTDYSLQHNALILNFIISQANFKRFFTLNTHHMRVMSAIHKRAYFILSQSIAV